MNTQKQTLVRLTANSLDSIGKQAIFEGTFNDGILIKPNSQIALHSCSLARDQDVITINSTNNKISFQISTAAGLHDIFLANGTYDSTTLITLLNNIQDSMNDQLDVLRNKEHNSFIDVKVNSQNRVEFVFMLGKRVLILDQNPNTNDPSISGFHFSKNNGALEVLRGGAGTDRYLTGTANYTPITGTRQYIYSQNAFAQGAGHMKARLDRFEVGAYPDIRKSGCIIGLLPDTLEIHDTLKSENSNHKIHVSDYVYAICTNTDGNPASPYMIKTPSTGGVFVETTVVPLNLGNADPLNNDIISIRMTKGSIELTVSQNGMTVEQGAVFVGKYDRRDDKGDIINLLPYIGIFGSDQQTRIGNVTMSFNPEEPETAGINFAQEVLAVGATPFPVAQARASIYNLIFAREDVAEFLGFETREQNPNSDSTLVTRYVAEDSVTKLFSTNTYLVEMMSEQLDSYDSFDGGRKNILCPIPLSDNVISNNGIIHFVPSNLVFINLRNEREKLIRNMRLRIVTNSYEPIQLEGIADLTLLIRSN